MDRHKNLASVLPVVSKPSLLSPSDFIHTNCATEKRLLLLLAMLDLLRLVLDTGDNNKKYVQ